MINPNDEVCYDLRTVCTEEEAVAKLLGWMQGTKRLLRLTVTEDGLIPDQLPHMYRLPDPLNQLMYEQREIASVRYHNAIVNENFDVVQHWEDMVAFWDTKAENATRYKLAIQNELSMPRPKLYIDPALTEETGVRHITLVSLDHWGRRTYGIGILENGTPSSDEKLPALPKRPRVKLEEQESAIIEAIQQLGLYPLKLPLWGPTTPGGKAAVLYKLNIPSPIFGTVKIFEKAWGRLSSTKQIAYSESPPK